MRIRVVLSGIAAGVLSLVALWLPWYVMHPGTLAPDWSYAEQALDMPEWLPVAVTVFCGVTIFAFGWVAARWNWAKTWRASLLSGAGVGLIAACLIYDFLGAFHYGLVGQEDILKSFYVEVEETQGLTMLVNGVAETGVLIYLNFIVVLFGGMVAGALGGLISAFDLEDVWGTPPREPEGWLFRIPAYALTVTGFGCLIVMIAALDVLEESATNVVLENTPSGVRMLPYFMYLAAYMTAMVFILTPMSVTWGWIVRSWKVAGMGRILYGVWVILSLLVAGWMLRGFLNYSFFVFYIETGFYPVPMIWAVILVSLAFGFLGGYWSPPAEQPEPRYHFSDWLGYALTQGILGGTQLFICVPAYAFSLTLILIVNIPHLMQLEPVETLPAAQIRQLFQVMSAAAQGLIVTSAVFGWVFGGIVFAVRKIMRVRPAVPQPEAGFDIPLS